MKKALSVLLSIIVAAGALGMLWTTVCAEDEPGEISVFVTLSDKGTLKIAAESVTVRDIDGDKKLTINDALYAAHEAKYEGGAEAGYNSYVHEEYGLCLGMLWGDTSGSFGYYLNNAMSMGLGDEIKEGDLVSAFVYASDDWSDTYCYFDKLTADVKAGETLTLTLSSSGFDASWNPVTLPVEGAGITIDGVSTQYKTNALGRVEIVLDRGGSFVISATSGTATLVPPVCLAEVEGDANEGGNTDSGSTDNGGYGSDGKDGPTGNTGNADNTNNTNNTNNGDGKDKEGGCASSMGAVGIALPLAIGCALFVKRKED